MRLTLNIWGREMLNQSLYARCEQIAQLVCEQQFAKHITKKEANEWCVEALGDILEIPEAGLEYENIVTQIASAVRTHGKITPTDYYKIEPLVDRFGYDLGGGVALARCSGKTGDEMMAKILSGMDRGKQGTSEASAKQPFSIWQWWSAGAVRFGDSLMAELTSPPKPENYWLYLIGTPAMALPATEAMMASVFKLAM